MTTQTTIRETCEALKKLDSSSAEYASQFVAHLLGAAISSGASDVHLQPTGSGIDVLWRLDGVLHYVGGAFRFVGIKLRVYSWR